MSNFVPPGLGWHRARPDFRDYSPGSLIVQEMLAQLEPCRSTRPAEVDLREFFPEVYDQGALDSSASHTCVGLFEYFERRTHGITVAPSRLFHYMNTQKLLRRIGNDCADLRTGLKAMIRCGIPPEHYWPYDTERCGEKLDPFLYSFFNESKSICYVRLDARNTTGTETLNVVRSFLAAGFPSEFGFPVPSSLSWEPDIPYRPTFDRSCGGQAVIAVGYDDHRLRSRGGALLIRNSWGSQWGEDGYGWLPYAYVEEQLAVDFWTLLRHDWLESGEFTRPRLPQQTKADAVASTPPLP